MTAREKFRALVVRLGGSTRVAKALGCSRAFIDMVRAGTRKPGLVLARRIEVASGRAITMRSWVER